MNPETDAGIYPPDELIDAWAREDGSDIDLTGIRRWAMTPDRPLPLGWRLMTGLRGQAFHFGCMRGTAKISAAYPYDQQVVPESSCSCSIRMP